MRLPWQKPSDDERAAAFALISLGSALRAHQEGDPARAVWHLRLAAQSITVLIDTWSAGHHPPPPQIEPGGE